MGGKRMLETRDVTMAVNALPTLGGGCQGSEGRKGEEGYGIHETDRDF
jgi:hypothetical protein